MSNVSPNLSTRFKKGQSGCPEKKWVPGQEGGGRGISRLRREFDQALADALMGSNPAERAQELADILWKAGRKGEPWAVTLLFARLSPMPIDLRLTKGDQDEFDYSRLNVEQLKQLAELLEQAQPKALAGELGGEEPQ